MGAQSKIADILLGFSLGPEGFFRHKAQEARMQLEKQRQDLLSSHMQLQDKMVEQQLANQELSRQQADAQTRLQSAENQQAVTLPAIGTAPMAGLPPEIGAAAQQPTQLKGTTIQYPLSSGESVPMTILNPTAQAEEVSRQKALTVLQEARAKRLAQEVGPVPGTVKAGEGVYSGRDAQGNPIYKTAVPKEQTQAEVNDADVLKAYASMKNLDAANLAPLDKVKARGFGKRMESPQTEEERQQASQFKQLSASFMQQRLEDLQQKKSDAETIAQGIADGTQPPDTSRLYGMAGHVRATLASQGFDLRKGELDWKATQRFFQSANGPQQLRLRQSIGTARQLVDEVEIDYNDLKAKAPGFGFKILNRASLTAMKNLPGEGGALAQRLEGRIADLIADLGNIYMGGNSPTDMAFKQAQVAFSSEWNPETFALAVKSARENIKYRENSIYNVGPVTSGQMQSATPQGPPNAGTGSGPAVGTVDGGFVFKGGDFQKQENWVKVAQ